MVSAARLAASQPPGSSTPGTTIPSVELSPHPVPNEEAVVSDSSLSQSNAHSTRSTPASSFSIHHPSPKHEAQSSALPPVEEIELSLTSECENPTNNSGNNIQQSIRDERSQDHHRAPVGSGRQDGPPDNNLQPPNHQTPYLTFLRGVLGRISQYLPRHELPPNTFSLVALILTAFFGYEMYRLAQIGTAAQLRQLCIEEETKGGRSNTCKEVFHHPIGSAYVPKATSVMKRMLGLLRVYQDPTIMTYSRERFVFTLSGLIACLCFFVSKFMAGWLNGGFFRFFRRLRPPPDSGPVHVRLTHPQVRSSSTGLGGGVQAAGHVGGQRRVIHGVQEQTYEEYDRTRKRSFQPNFEMHLTVPFWKRRDLGSLQQRGQERPAPAGTESTVHTVGQVGDALKGFAPNESVFSSKDRFHRLRRVLQKASVFQYTDSDDDIEPPLTALLADPNPEPEQQTKRKVAITSGVVALGLAQAGCTLASSIGGSIGPEILVKSETIDEMEDLVRLPTSGQERFASGVDI